MISDFHHLSEKINELAALTQALRRENAELRQAMVAMHSKNADMAARMGEAQRRVMAVMEQLPAPEPEVDADAEAGTDDVHDEEQAA